MESNGIQVHDIYDIWYLPWWRSSWIIGSAIILALLCILFFIYLIKRKFKKRTHYSSWDIALKNLNMIAHRNSQDEYDRKLFYFELTTILKTYLSARYSTSLEGKTDTEVVEIIEKQGMPGDLLEQLKKILDRAVIIKFSENSVQKKDMEYDIDRSVDIIRNTIPKSNNNSIVRSRA